MTNAEADAAVNTSEFRDAFTSLRVLEGFYRSRGKTDLADQMSRALRSFSIHHIDGNPHNNAPANCRVVWTDRNFSR